MIQAVLLFSALISALLAIFVLLNNPRSVLFRYYFAFGIVSSGWILSNAFTIEGIFSLHGEALLQVSQFITPLSLLTSVLYYFFLKLFVEGKASKEQLLVTVPTALILPFSFTPLNVSLDSHGELKLGSLFIPYVVVLLLNVVFIFRTVYKHRRRDIHDVNKQLQLRQLRLATWATLVPLLGLGTILPLFSSSQVSNLAPLFSLCFLIMSAYSMFKHRLFDVRLAVGRAVAYLVSLALFGSVYGFLVFGTAQWLLNIKFSVAAQILLATATGFAALSFHSFKVYFDKKTQRLFYQDAYSPEELYDEYNKALVSTIDLNLLLHRTTKIISSYIKTEYALVAVGEGKHGFRNVGTNSLEVTEEDVAIAADLIRGVRQSITLTDDLPPEQHELQKILQRYGVAVVVRLATKMHREQTTIGYLILGTKKSGNPYSAQDITVIETLGNELFIALQNALRFEEIERFNETLQQRVTDATRKLRHSNEKLKQLNETKDDFIGMASHQLRTPLTSVKGYLSLVLDEDAGKINKTQRQLLTQAFVSSQRMVSLIADLLNVSRLRTGKFIIERTPTNIAEMISDEIGQLREMADSRGVELLYETPADFPALPLDETKTRQVIMNFIDNAIYYTPTGGRIKVELQNLPKIIELRVVDNGIGVPAGERHHLFTKFYRAKNAQRARPDGTGLGLFMAKKVITAQGGSIIFDSAEGQGSVFGFAFPKELKRDATPVPAETEA